MKRLLRGLITGSVIGAGVGVAMLVMSRRNNANNLQSQEKARTPIGVVKNNAIRWTSAVKSGTEAISRRLARRSS
jgi:hypothetical protein